MSALHIDRENHNATSRMQNAHGEHVVVYWSEYGICKGRTIQPKLDRTDPV